MDAVFNRLNELDWPEAVSRPDFADYEVIAVTDETVERLAAAHGIRVNGKGRGNAILLSRGFAQLGQPLSITFKGGNNICLIEADVALRGAINYFADGIAVIRGGQHALSLGATLYDGGRVFWGRGASTFGCRIWADGGKRVVVGDDCLFSEGITIRTSDHHSIIDLESFEQTNHPMDVMLERHVWVSPNVQILRGVTIGRGAIIGAGSIVTKDVPAKELWAGVPAKCLKKNVSWVGSHPARPEQIAALRHLLDM